MISSYESKQIIIIHKDYSANKIENFRFVVLTNFKYMIISKILTDVLTTIIRRLVYPLQKDIIPKRNLIDN